MQTLPDDAIWAIAATAREAVQAKSEWIQHSARTVAEVAVDVVASFTTEDLTTEDRALLMRNGIEMLQSDYRSLLAISLRISQTNTSSCNAASRIRSEADCPKRPPCL